MTMMEHVIINGTVEGCMAIYLGMAMEMPWWVGMVAVLRKVYGGCMIPAKRCAVLERLAMVEGWEKCV